MCGMLVQGMVGHVLIAQDGLVWPADLQLVHECN